MTGNRTIIAIDLKSFYASVECVERGLDPLTTNLVVADETRTSKTICLAVTPSLKAYGLSGRSRLYEVEQKAEEIKKRTGKELEYIVAPPRMGYYMEYSARVYDVYLKYISSEDIHVYSVDEVFMDVTDYLSFYRMSSRELAITMIRDVLKETGITATAGIGTNMYLAKIAMDIVAKHMPADKNGVRIAELDEKTFREKLWDHKPITDFWSIGKGTANRLARNAIYTMGDIAELSLVDQKWFYKTFGIDAEILIDHAWGIEPVTIKDIKGYKTQTNSLSSGQVLKKPYSFEDGRIIVREMTELMVLDMVKKELITDSITLTVGYDRENVDNGTYTGEIRHDIYGRALPDSAHGTANTGVKTSSTRLIMAAVMKLFDEIVDPGLTIRRVTICANNVIREEFHQYDLFSKAEEGDKEKRLQQAVLDIQQRFGKNAILKGTSLQENATTIERNGQVGGHKA